LATNSIKISKCDPCGLLDKAHTQTYLTVLEFLVAVSDEVLVPPDFQAFQEYFLHSSCTKIDIF